MPLDRLWLRSARLRLSRWLLNEIVLAPVEGILHPSAMRLRALATSMFFGHFIFYLTWAHWFPQPFENLGVRMLMAVLGLGYLLPTYYRDANSRRSAWAYSITSWLSMPAFFFWMYEMNGGNKVWLASLGCMLLIYYHLTDWRLATIGTFLGLVAASALTYIVAPDAASILDHPGENLLVLGFSWVSAFLLGASSANLRRTRLINTLSTMGVMAHELRTPLATVNLMGDVLRNLAQADQIDNRRPKLEELSNRLQNLVRVMNRQIDTQISNAQLLRLPKERALIHASRLVREVVENYPFRSAREQACLTVHVQQDFSFHASPALFAQMLSNLIKNALHSLASSGVAPRPGDLHILVDLHEGQGRLVVADKGIGIAHHQQARIFEPFFSTQSGAGSGLGLTFCKNVVDTVDGEIRVQSEPNAGATFLIDIPLEAPSST